MAYTPTNWNTGDVITAEKLNKLEQGVQNEQVGPQGAKGDKGEDGTTIDAVTVTVDSNTGTPSATGSISGTTLTLDFKNLKGAKGDTGAAGAKGDAGAAGTDGKSITAIKLTTTEGAVTGGEATLSDGSKITITVSEEEA